MSGRTVPKQKTSVAISEEARKLLALMAEKSGISQSSVLELAIRERARREKVSLADGASATAAAVTPDREAAHNPLRQLVERARAGDEAAAEEMRLEIERLRASPTTPRAESELSPEEREARCQHYIRLAEQIRASVPEEWTPEEIERRVEQAVTTVREERRACRC